MKLCVLHGLFFFWFYGLNIADINLIMVSGWICRHLHMHRDSASGCCSAPTKESCVSQALPNCSWQLVTFFKCSGSLFHVVVCPSAPSPRNIIHLPTCSCPPCLPGSDISSCTVRCAQTILGCEIGLLMSLLVH